MSNKNSQTTTKTFEAEAEIYTIYDENPPRVEECHGYHHFDESEEVDKQLETFKIIIGEQTIDLTDRLTDEEKNLILESSSDV